MNMETHYARIGRDGRLTIPTKLRARLSQVMCKDHDAVFARETVFIERHLCESHVKMWVAESSDQMSNEQTQLQRSQRRMTTGCIAANVDDSYRIHIPLGFRRKTGLSDAIVWVVRGREIEIWSAQRWELGRSVCAENESVLLPQDKLSGRVRRMLESRGEAGPQALAQVDSRGRLTMPILSREDLGKDVIILPGLDRCLAVYSSQQWRVYLEGLSQSRPTPEHFRGLNRVVFASVFPANLEPIGRLAIPKPLQRCVRPGREVTVLVSPCCTYVWDAEAWNNLPSV